MQYHFVGKDITRFHCVIWPAMLMAAGLPVTHTVFGHGFLLTKGEKMSKSKGNALRPADLVKVFGVDAYRYYFMSDVQFGADGSISLERMVQVYNADLANTWGNLVQPRVQHDEEVLRLASAGGARRSAREGEPAARHFKRACIKSTTPPWAPPTSRARPPRCRSWPAA